MLSAALLSVILSPSQGPATVIKPPLAKAADAKGSAKSFATGKYRNLFREIGKTDAEIADKINLAWNQLFYGDNENERVYYPVGDRYAYIKDIGNDDIRTEGISYGMMAAVQLNQKDEFDRLWRWADEKMRFKDGPNKGFFSWRCNEEGGNLADSAASDGEEYFATALFFADSRWGSSGGINYRGAADEILVAMLHRPEGQTVSTPMFDLKEKQVVFVPNGAAATFTDASYHLPAFYELWAKWAKQDQAFWREAAATSRGFLKKAVHPVTGLAPDYSTFDGKPTKPPWNDKGTQDNFQSDAFRVGCNIAVDYAWFGVDPSQVELSNRMLGFFAAQKPDYVSGYTVDGKPTVSHKSPGLVAMNAVATLASTRSDNARFVNELWDTTIPTGKWRYYDGLLYLFGLLHASGEFKIWKPR